jgi:dihydrofolate reductase
VTKHTRKVTFGGASSLDGYFARKDDSVDWLLWSPEAGKVMSAYWKTIDTIVMGRRTYEAGLKLTKGKGNPYSGFNCYVMSRTLKPKKGDKFEIMKGDAVEFVRQLKAKPGKDICIMGGGKLARSLLDGDVIDEIGFNIQPVMLGQGIPLFYELKQQIDLELVDCQRFKNGCVYVLYRIKNPKTKRRRA